MWLVRKVVKHKSLVKVKFGKWLGQDTVFFDKPQFRKVRRNSHTKLSSFTPATAFVSV